MMAVAKGGALKFLELPLDGDKTIKEYSNKRPMGHIAHLRKQFKSINTYDYIIRYIKRRKNPLLSL